LSDTICTTTAKSRERNETKVIFFFSFRDTGKGLGKNESGITEPVKLASNQNKAGIGYSENDPWWERLFNDASKNVKIESHDNKISLNVVKNSSALHVENKLLNSLLKYENNLKQPQNTNFIQNLQKFVEAERTTKTCEHVAVPKLDEVVLKLRCNKTANDTTKHNLMSSGKLERIAEQDRILSNTESPFGATAAGENIMTYRKTSAESDVEESEHEIDNNASTLQSTEETKDFDLCRSTRKKHRRRISKLAEQLGTCNLEEKPSSSLSSKESSEKILKNKEKRMNSSVIDTRDYRMNPYEMFYKSKRLYKSRDQTFNTESNNQKIKSERCIVRRGWCKKDVEKSERLRSVELRLRNVELSKSELRNSIEGNEMTLEQYKNWIIFDLTRKELKPSCVNPIVSSNKQQNVQKLKIRTISKCNAPIQHVPMHCTDPADRYTYQDLLNILRSDIQKRKNQQCRSKNIKKIVEKLKGESFACELNSVIKNLTAFGLTEKVNVKTMKMKPTQNHLTPV